MMNKGKGKSYCDCTEKSRQSFQKPTPQKYLDLVWFLAICQYYIIRDIRLWSLRVALYGDMT